MYTKIAVIDSGVNLEHPDLKNARIVSLYINSDKNFEITQSSNDSYGHGTACAWIIKDLYIGTKQLFLFPHILYFFQSEL